jgi:hypothetical protein
MSIGDLSLTEPETFSEVHVIFLLTGKTDKLILILSYA